jgi:hypothetical protein
VLDDYTPLRNLKADTLAQDSHLFPVSDALMYIRSAAAVGSQGASFYLAPNPAYGATITYFTKEAPKTKRQKRQEAERAAAQKNETPPYPSKQQLREEAEEEPPAIILTITDPEGKVVRRLNAPATPGVQRVTLPPGAENLDLSGFGFSFGPQGVLAMPGKYTVKIARKVDGIVTELPGVQTFNVIAEGTEGMSAADRQTLAEFQRKVSNLQRAVTGASDTANNANTRIGLMRRAAQEAPGATPALINEVKALDGKIRDILHALRGGRDNTDIPPPSISQRVNTIAQRIRLSAIRPTQSQIENYNIAAEEFRPILARLKTLTEVEIPKLEKALDAAGAPWTPGRLPEWTDK